MASGHGPICISVINMKGGVGKTTIAALLSRFAATILKRRVLCVDLDPQANLSQTLMGEHAYRQFLNDGSASIVEVFSGYHPPASNSPTARALDASSVVRSSFPDNLKVIPSRFDFSNNLNRAISPDPRCLAGLVADNFGDEDLILIDCAPTESVFTQAAYHASRYILVPVRPEFFATIGFPLLKESLRDFRGRNLSHHIDVIGIVVNNATYDGGNQGGPEKLRAMEEIEREARNNGWRIFENEIGYSRGFPKIMRGDYSYSGNALPEFFRFATEFFGRPELAALQP